MVTATGANCHDTGTTIRLFYSDNFCGYLPSLAPCPYHVGRMCTPDSLPHRKGDRRIQAIFCPPETSPIRIACSKVPGDAGSHSCTVFRRCLQELGLGRGDRYGAARSRRRRRSIQTSSSAVSSVLLMQPALSHGAIRRNLVCTLLHRAVIHARTHAHLDTCYSYILYGNASCGCCQGSLG